MKRFLLTAGDGYYPHSGDSDWVGIFETREEAEALIVTETIHDYYSRGPRKGQIKSSRKTYIISGREVDWYHIIDLEKWYRFKCEECQRTSSSLQKTENNKSCCPECFHKSNCLLCDECGAEVHWESAKVKDEMTVCGDCF